MARSKDRRPYLDGGRTPQADTFRALNVPHVGAQRRESQGDNYRRMASAYGRLSNSLMTFGAGMAAHEKAQKEADYENDRLNAVWKAAQDDGPGYNPKSPANAARHDMDIATGFDPGVRIATNLAALESTDMPRYIQQEREALAAHEAAGWKVKTGAMTTKFDPVSGEDVEAEEEVRLTPGILEQLKLKDYEAIGKAYPGETRDMKRARTQLYDFIDKKYAVREKALNDYVQKERVTKATTVIRDLTPTTVNQLAQSGVPIDQLLDKAIDANLEPIKKGMNANQLTREDATEAVLDGLKLAMLDPEDKSYDTNVDAARVFMELYDKGKIGGHVLKNHPSYATDTKAMFKIASELVVQQDHQVEVGAKVEEISKALGSTSWDLLDVADVVTERGTAKETTSAKKLKTMVAKAKENEIMMPNGIRMEIPQHQQDLLILDKFRGTGMASPTLAARADRLALSYDAENDETIGDALSVYEGLLKTNIGNIGDYFKGDKKRIIEDIYLLKLSGLSQEEASVAAYEAYQDSSKIMPVLTSDHRKVYTDWLKDNKFTLSKNDREQIERTFNIRYGDHTFNDRDDVAEALNNITAHYLRPRGTLNGFRFEVPAGQDRDVWTSKVEALLTIKPIRQMVPDIESKQLRRSDNGYYVIDPATGDHVLDSEGDFMYVSDNDVNAYYIWASTSMSNEKRSKAADALTNKYGAGFSSFDRRMQQRKEAQKRAEEEDYIAP